MKKKNALERFRAYWKTLNDKERQMMWDLLAFIRGPDWPIRDDPKVKRLKELTTCRFRALILGDELAEKLKEFVIPKMEPNTEEELKEMLGLMKRVPSHFTEHYLAATSAIEYFGYKPLTEDEFNE